MGSAATRQGVQHARRFVFVGASYDFIPAVVRDFLLARRFEGSTFTLINLDPEPLRIVASALKRMVSQSGQEIKIHGTMDMDGAFAGADYVFPAFTGREQTRELDAKIAFKYGVVQSSAETTGPAGLARLLRKLPFAVDIAQRLHRDSPKGRIINFAKPMAALTAAMIRHSQVHSVTGRSSAVFGCRNYLANLYQADPAQMELIVAGVSGLSWVMQVLIGGHDHTHRLDGLLAKAAARNGHSKARPFAASLRIWEQYGFLPAAGDHRVCEFFAPFARKGSPEVRALGLKPFKAGGRQKTLKAELINWAQRGVPAAEMEKRSGEDAPALLLAMLDGDNSRHTVNMPHDGALGQGIAPGAVVECMASVDAKGARGIALGDLPPVVKALTQRLNAMHDLTVEAALEGNRKKVIQALLLDPSIIEFKRVPAMVDEYLKAHRQGLPRFWK